MRKELGRREMQLLAYVERHPDELFSARRIGCVIGMAGKHVPAAMRALRDEGLLDYAPSVRPPALTAAGRRMLWPYPPLPAC